MEYVLIIWLCCGLTTNYDLPEIAKRFAAIKVSQQTCEEMADLLVHSMAPIEARCVRLVQKNK